ncbi:MAG: 3D domain-containing protein [Clostridium sp.]|nr:hypothetical protein [Clostridium sp.]
MRKKLSLLLASVLIMSNVHCVHAANGDLQQNKIQFNDMSAELTSINDEISKLNGEIYSLEKKVSEYEGEINNFEEEISVKESTISELKKEIKNDEEMLSSRIRELYKNGTTSSFNTLTFILNSESLGELIDRISYANKIVDADNKLIEEHNNNLDELNKTISDLENQKNTVDSLNDQVKSDLNTIQEKKSLLEDKKVQVSKEIEKLKEKIAENEENLVKHQIEVINSASPNRAQLTEAISVLSSLLPEISTKSVIDKTNNAISTANAKLATLKEDDTSAEFSFDLKNVDTSKFKKAYAFVATAYCNDAYTSTGLRTHRDPNGISTVAIDPTVIAYGSKLYIPGYGYAIAADCGGAIKGNRIDLFMLSEAECFTFGRRSVTVYLVAGPGEW